jgi:hypothetical protein
MATSVTQSLFGMAPQAIQAQRAAELEKQAMSFARLSPMESARQGLFYGVNQLGNALGQAMGYEDPEIAQARAAQGLLGGTDMGDPEALREAARNTNDPRVRASLVDRALQIEKQQADIGRLNALAQGGGRTGGGTGPERMLTHISKVDTALQAGEPVSEADITLANNYREYFARRKTYQMPDGSILTLDINDFAGQRQAESQGGIEAPTASGTAQSAPRTGGAPGVRVTQTPASAEARAKELTGLQNNIDTIQSDLTNIDEAIGMVNAFSTGPIGAVLSLGPTDARRLRRLVEGIDAAKVFNELQKLRDGAASGASGLGQVTEREISLLMNRLRVLDPNGRQEDLIKDLQYISDSWKSIQDRIKGELEGKQPDRPASASPAPRTAPQQASSVDNTSVIDRVMADPRNAGKSRAQVEAALRKRGLIK